MKNCCICCEEIADKEAIHHDEASWCPDCEDYHEGYLCANCYGNSNRIKNKNDPLKEFKKSKEFEQAEKKAIEVELLFSSSFVKLTLRDKIAHKIRNWLQWAYFKMGL